MSSALRRLEAEDAVMQLRRRDGTMARLGSEDGVPKLDWVEGVARLLENEVWLEAVEAEAAEIVERGIRHIIWAGMGGSVMTVRVLTEMGFCAAASAVVIHPLDSTDPAALNSIVRQLAAEKGMRADDTGPLPVRDLLSDVMMIGVSMGMTSEEPITHLEWFLDLLTEADLPVDQHAFVMTLPGSYLERFAQERGLPARPLQLDGGTGTGGRMSAPTTRVFLLPAALALYGGRESRGRLRSMLTRAWELYDLDLATTRPGEHPFVRLAAALSEASSNGACLMSLGLSPSRQPTEQWLEQLLEESLGKGGKGVVIVQRSRTDGLPYRATGALDVAVESDPQEGRFILDVPPIQSDEPLQILSRLAAWFLGWQLTMALYGYLQGIQFAGQPAVEAYKTRARALRTDNPVRVAETWGTTLREAPFTLLLPPGQSATGSLVSCLAGALEEERPTYLDLTINGELSDMSSERLEETLRELGNRVLQVPIKLRRAPAAYHSTEQSEMDGPPGLVSLRVVALQHEASLLGTYTDTFLLAQAVGTWQSMVEAGRLCFLILLDGTLEEAVPALERLLSDIANALRSESGGGVL